MRSQPTDAVCVVTAGGAGVGRFLAAALLEALQVGGDVAVQASIPPPAGGAAGFDFVFRRPEKAEVIRVGVDAEHRVVSAELFRGHPGGGASVGGHVWSEGLRDALDGGDTVAELKWRRGANEPAGLEIVMRRESRFSVPLAG